MAWPCGRLARDIACPCPCDDPPPEWPETLLAKFDGNERCVAPLPCASADPAGGAVALAVRAKAHLNNHACVGCGRGRCATAPCRSTKRNQGKTKICTTALSRQMRAGDAQTTTQPPLKTGGWTAGAGPLRRAPRAPRENRRLAAAWEQSSAQGPQLGGTRWGMAAAQLL
jgi:hypothetical protein